MTIVSRRILVPMPGKSALTLERAKRAASILASHGALVRVFSVVMGQDAGNIEILARYANFTEGSKVSAALASDPQAQQLQQEREKNPAAAVHGPYVYRLVFGEAAPQPVIMRRHYQVERRNLKAALEMLPEAKAALHPGTGMLAVVPVIAPDMASLSISYYADSLEHLGQNLDEYGMSEKFQAVVAKASQFGTLTSSDVLVAV
jgi:hypothetical protein